MKKMLIMEENVVYEEVFYQVKVMFDDVQIIDLFLDSKFESTEKKPKSYYQIYYVFLNYTKRKLENVLEEGYFKDEENRCLADNILYYNIDVHKAIALYQKKDYSNYLLHQIRMIEFISKFMTEEKYKLVDYIRNSKFFNIFQREKLIQDILSLK